MAFIRATYRDDTERMRPVSALSRQQNATALYEFTERFQASRPEWQRRGNCAGMAGASLLFFPERGNPTAETKALCDGCPVKDECLEYGLHEKFGIWGGTSERQRRKLRPKNPPEHGERRTYKRGCRCGDCTEANRVYLAGRRVS